jgi:hypothetical protein
VQIADGTDGVDIYVVSVVICALAAAKILFFFLSSAAETKKKKIPNPQLNSPRRGINHLRATF